MDADMTLPSRPLDVGLSSPERIMKWKWQFIKSNKHWKAQFICQINFNYRHLRTLYAGLSPYFVPDAFANTRETCHTTLAVFWPLPWFVGIFFGVAALGLSPTLQLESEREAYCLSTCGSNSLFVYIHTRFLFSKVTVFFVTCDTKRHCPYLHMADSSYPFLLLIPRDTLDRECLSLE